jgi:glycogen(starch) synthase
MRVLIVTDAFPPACGGSGWSTYELARGLRARGHDVLVAQPRVSVPWWRSAQTFEPRTDQDNAARSPRVVEASTSAARARAPDEPHLEPRSPGRATSRHYDGFVVHEQPVWAPPVPFVHNYFANERLWRRFGAWLGSLAREQGVHIVHGQHLRSGPAAVVAGRAAGLPVVCTVRDYWPVCYWSDLIVDRTSAHLCPGCSAGMMTRCLRPHAGIAWPAALGAIPYMRGNLVRKRAALAAADAIVAVSSAIADDLRRLAPELRGRRVETIPNPVDVASLREQAAARQRPLAGPYAIYVGKLAANKGVGKLVEALARAHLDWPLVVVGEGPERVALEAAMRRAGHDVRFTGWLSREEALGWLAHAELVVFPSHGPESLSRVLLEASALGVPAAAMETGGTRDIVVHEETGLLSRSAGELGDHLARLRRDAALRRRLGAAARRRIEERFDVTRVAARIEALYVELVRSRQPDRAS